MREVEGRKLAKLILKGQGGLRQTSVAILNIDTDVTDKLKWRSWKAAQQLQIRLIFVCDDGVVTARDDLVQKRLCLEIRHKPQNVEQALRQLTTPTCRRHSRRSQLRVDTTCARLSTPCSCWDSVLQVASCQLLTSQRQLPAFIICCRALTCLRCLSCWSRTAKNSVEYSSVRTSLPVDRALRPRTDARLQLRSWHLEMWLSALRVTQRGIKTRPIPPRTSSILAPFRR